MHMEVAELADMMLIMKVGKVADMVLPLVMKILPRTKFDSSGWISQFWQNFIISAKLPGIPKIGQFRNFCDVSSYDCWCWPLVVFEIKFTSTSSLSLSQSRRAWKEAKWMSRAPNCFLATRWDAFLQMHCSCSCTWGAVELWNCWAAELWNSCTYCNTATPWLE